MILLCIGWRGDREFDIFLGEHGSLFRLFSSSPLFFFSYHLILHSSSAACPLPRRAAPMIVETYARTGEKFGLEGWGC